MAETPDTETVVNTLASKAGIQNPVRISTTLLNTLTPNAFMAQLGITVTERIDTLFDILKGNLIPHQDQAGEVIPTEVLTIPLVITQGPYIREHALTITATMQRDKAGEDTIVLDVI